MSRPLTKAAFLDDDERLVLRRSPRVVRLEAEARDLRKRAARTEDPVLARAYGDLAFDAERKLDKLARGGR